MNKLNRTGRAIGTALISAAMILGQPALAKPVASSPTQGATVAVCKTTGPVVTPALNMEQIERLHQIVRKLVDSGVAPGAVLLIEQGGKRKVDFAYGEADREAHAPMRGDALFRLYSMTKPITSLAAMKLVAQGKLSLDDPDARFIPEFAEAKVETGNGQYDALARPVTIRDLLRHTAGISYRGDGDAVSKLYAERGIPAGPGVDEAPKDGSPKVESLEELARRVAQTPLRSQPGVAWTYGNATDVLGRVVEVATGKGLPAALDELVLRPVGMRKTAFQVAAELKPQLTTAYISPAPKKGGEGVLSGVDIQTLKGAPQFPADKASGSIFLASPKIAYGGAGLIGDAADYLRFTQMMRQGGKIDGRRVAPAWVVDQMRSNHVPPEARSNAATLSGLGFGLGFATRIAPTNEGPIFPQCGYFWGGAASTFFWIDPAGKTSGVLMTQVFGGDASSFWLAIIRELYGKGKARTGLN